jgi:proteasome assembly chaperone (PAC2) family protein
MNFLKKEERAMRDPIKVTLQPELEKPSLIVSWVEDAGNVGSKVIDYLNKRLMNRSFCQIHPVDFFSLGGVEIRNNVAQLPESRFYAGERNDLITFISDVPHYNQYKFLTAMLDVAEHHCKGKEVYTVSGLVSSITHTIPRRIFAVFNEPAMQEKLRGYGLHDITYEGPPHINSYLLWVAQKRGFRGVSLWPQIPFYLAASEDPQAVKLILSFFNRRFNLGPDIRDLDERIKKQNTKIAQLRTENSEINKYIEMVEAGLSLTEEEQMKLVEEVPKFLKKRS